MSGNNGLFLSVWNDSNQSLTPLSFLFLMQGIQASREIASGRTLKMSVLCRPLYVLVKAMFKLSPLHRCSSYTVTWYFQQKLSWKCTKERKLLYFSTEFDLPWTVKWISTFDSFLNYWNKADKCRCVCINVCTYVSTSFIKAVHLVLRGRISHWDRRDSQGIPWSLPPQRWVYRRAFYVGPGFKLTSSWAEIPSSFFYMYMTV